ncbi:MAG: endonuclease/exonuclease/phosphatase family protein, partial [Limisphaerales bacterium]
GMNLYSRFELVEPEWRYLVDPEVPSIRTGLELPDGKLVHFYGVHPRPPGLKRPEINGREASTQRDAELVMVAKEIARIRAPVIVAGDFNDVAWSHTTRLFQRISRLLDPRVGRGLFNSYGAQSIMMRCPVDHVFHSDHFKLAEIKRLRAFGSDHYPIFISLCLERGAEAEQEAPREKPGDHQEAREMARRPAEKEG